MLPAELRASLLLPGGTLGLLAVLALAPGCSSDATPLEVSAALAQAFQARLDAQAEETAAIDAPGWPLWQADLFRAGFEGVDDGVELSDPLRGTIEAYWDNTAVVDIPADASLAEQGALLDPHHRDTGERFEAYTIALLAMAEEDDETAARGLLAIAVTQHVSAIRSPYFQFPRADLMDRVLLDGQVQPVAPACALFDPTAGTTGTSLDCGLPLRQRHEVERAGLGLVNTWLDEIEEVDPSSPWRDVVIASRVGEQIRIIPNDHLTLPESTSTTPVEIATNVVITTESIGIDGEEAVRFPPRVPHDAAALGADWPALPRMLRVRAEAGKYRAVDTNTRPTGTWLLQADAATPLPLVADVLAAASAEGFHRPQLVVFPSPRYPLLRYTSVQAIPTTCGETSPTPGATTTPVVAIGPDGYVLRTPDPHPLPATTPGHWPTDALTDELIRVRAGHDGTVVAIALPPDPTIPYGTLVATADAVRQHGCGTEAGCQPLFPDIVLTVAQ